MRSAKLLTLGALGAMIAATAPNTVATAAPPTCGAQLSDWDNASYTGSIETDMKTADENLDIELKAGKATITVESGEDADFREIPVKLSGTELWIEREDDAGGTSFYVLYPTECDTNVTAAEVLADYAPSGAAGQAANDNNDSDRRDGKVARKG